MLNHFVASIVLKYLPTSGYQGLTVPATIVRPRTRINRRAHAKM